MWIPSTALGGGLFTFIIALLTSGEGLVFLLGCVCVWAVLWVLSWVAGRNWPFVLFALGMVCLGFIHVQPTQNKDTNSKPPCADTNCLREL